MKEKEISSYLGRKLCLDTYGLKVIVSVYLVTLLRSKTYNFEVHFLNVSIAPMSYSGHLTHLN